LPARSALAGPDRSADSGLAAAALVVSFAASATKADGLRQHQENDDHPALHHVSTVT
jgi:hypothetical protein